MRKVSIGGSNLDNPRISVKQIAEYLDSTVKEKDRLLHSLASELKRGNPSIKELAVNAQAVRDYSAYLLMAIKTNSPHYLK